MMASVRMRSSVDASVRCAPFASTYSNLPGSPRRARPGSASREKRREGFPAMAGQTDKEGADSRALHESGGVEGDRTLARSPSQTPQLVMVQLLKVPPILP